MLITKLAEAGAQSARVQDFMSHEISIYRYYLPTAKIGYPAHATKSPANYALSWTNEQGSRKKELSVETREPQSLATQRGRGTLWSRAEPREAIVEVVA